MFTSAPHWAEGRHSGQRNTHTEEYFVGERRERDRDARNILQERKEKLMDGDVRNIVVGEGIFCMKTTKMALSRVSGRE